MILGDAAELNAIQRLFHHDIAVSSTKGATGHLLGASGAIESIFTILALKHEILPPTLNLEQTDWTLNLVPKVAQNKQLSYAMSNSFGFGGTNCSILFKSVV